MVCLDISNSFVSYCSNLNLVSRYYPPGCGVPWATIVGSANLGERSVRRDLEAQAAIFTVSPELQVIPYFIVIINL